LQDLIQIPSVNIRENEDQAVQHTTHEAETPYFESLFAARNQKQPNVMMNYRTGNQGFVLIGNMNPVAERNHQAWISPPFEGGCSSSGNSRFMRLWPNRREPACA